MAEYALLRKGLVVLILGAFIGCSSANKARIVDIPSPPIEGEITKEKVENTLRAKLLYERELIEKERERHKKQIVSIPSGSATYLYKYYDEFPEDVDNVSISINPTETFSPSYRAEAKFRKIRFQTRYSKSRSKASRDNNFIRDEGIQKNTYLFNGSTWQLSSSIFEVTKTSIYDENGWTASQGRIRRVEEEEPELFVDKLGNLFGLLD